MKLILFLISGGNGGCLKEMKDTHSSAESAPLHTIQHFHLPAEETKRRKFSIQVSVGSSVPKKKTLGAPLEGFSTISIKE